MKTKIFGILAFVMVALAGTGIAYGHWYDYAYVNATITTGYLQVNLSDDTTPTISGGCTDCPSVVTATQSLSEEQSNTLDINITNAYPSIMVNGTFNIDNDGTVPAQLYSVTWTATDTDSAPGDINFVADGNGGWYLVDDGVNMMDITLTFTNSTGATVTPNEICVGNTIWGHWSISFLEPLEQGTTFWLSSTWTFQNCESDSAVTGTD